MVEKGWSELEYICPINIGRIRYYSRDFDSKIPKKITFENLDKCKEDVLNARKDLNNMLNILMQNLYDDKILKTSNDKILFSWLVDNLGRYLKRLDDEEFGLIIKYDEPGKNSEVGISRISAYAKLLETTSDTMIYECLLKATEEYRSIKETKTIKKEPRTFLYIFFQIWSVTMAIFGGLTREKSYGKKGVVNSMPLSWQNLISPVGEKTIKEGYMESTGTTKEDMENIDDTLSSFDEILDELSEDEND